MTHVLMMFRHNLMGMPHNVKKFIISLLEPWLRMISLKIGLQCLIGVISKSIIVSSDSTFRHCRETRNPKLRRVLHVRGYSKNLFIYLKLDDQVQLKCASINNSLFTITDVSNYNGETLFQGKVLDLLFLLLRNVDSHQKFSPYSYCKLIRDI